MNSIGVIITTYGESKLWEEAVKSVIKQTINKDITLVLSDDATPTFNTEIAYNRIVKLGGKVLKRIIVRKNTKNVGTVKNINFAAKEINCKYILLLAGDDQLYNETVISDYLKLIEDKPEYVAIVGQSLQFSIDMTKAIGVIDSDEVYRKKFRLLNESGIPLFTALSIKCFIPSSGMMYKKIFLDEIGWFNEDYRLVEDWPMFLIMAKKKYKIFYSKIIAVKHRVGGVSSTNLLARKQLIYQTDLINVIDNEILNNLKFVENKKQSLVKQISKEKKIIYEFRYMFSNYNKINKLKFLIRNLFLIPIIANRFIRRIKNEEKFI